MNRLGRRIELVANVCVIVLAIVIGAALIRRFLLKSPSNSYQVAGISAGSRIDLPGFDWAKNRKTLLLVLSIRCRFCTASAPFYQKLVNETSSSESAKLLALLPESADQSRNYLKRLNLQIDDVRQGPPASWGARVTPTLILVNSAGVVMNAWVGQLPPDKETEVLAELK